MKLCSLVVLISTDRLAHIYNTST